MTAETITWHTDPADLPDADITVLIELDPDSDASEPVWLGFHDGTGWLDVTGDAVEVVSWAHIPKGLRHG